MNFMVYLYLVVCLLFVILHGFFAASEISFISSRPVRLRHRLNKGDRSAKAVYEHVLRPEKFLATTLVGTNISIVLSSSLLTFFLIKIGIEASNVWITFIFTPFVVIFAELIPKNIGRFFREDFSCKIVGFIRFFEVLFLLIVEGIERLSRALVKLITRKAATRSLYVTKEEIKSLVREIERQGGIDKGEKKAIEEIFEFRSDRIKDVCVNVKNVVALDYADSYETVLSTIEKSGFTRYPVYSSGGRSAFGGKNKEIAGYINIYDLFYEDHKNWQVLIRPIAKVGFNQKIHEAFTRLKSKKESIALVLKGGKAYGIITIQDIIREIITSIIKI